MGEKTDNYKQHNTENPLRRLIIPIKDLIIRII